VGVGVSPVNYLVPFRASTFSFFLLQNWTLS
jgi:hypothetical protein